MSVFSRTSRYAKHSVAYVTTDADGREVTAVTPAHPPAQTILGDHLMNDFQRLDHLADFYLDDPTAFWRLAEANDAIVPDALLARQFILIPVKR
jgi:hypothetical protein